MIATFAFIDTNILLDFYRAPESELSLAIFEEIRKQNANIIISDQVESEFLKNRRGVIDTYLQNLPACLEKALRMPVLLDRTEEAIAIRNASKDLDKKIDGIRDKLKKLRDFPFTDDPVFMAILPYFSSGIMQNMKMASDDIKDRIFLAAIKRFYRGLPPRKNDDLTIGDAINWEWCVHCCSAAKANLIIVSRDGDYAQDRKNKQSPINEILKIEFEERVGKEFSISLERNLCNALQSINMTITPNVAAALEDSLIEVEEHEYTEDWQCRCCGERALMDVQCAKCWSYIVCDAGDAYTVRGNHIYENDYDGELCIMKCPKCKSTKMYIEYQDNCESCVYMMNKAFADD